MRDGSVRHPPVARLAGELEQGVSSADVLCLLISRVRLRALGARGVALCLAAEEKGLRVMPVILRAAPIPDEFADHVALEPRVASATTPP